MGESAGEFGPAPPQNPATGPNGISNMHGDSAASDTTPFRGPDPGNVAATFVPLASSCPLVLMGTDGLPVAQCMALADRTPSVYLLDPETGVPIATLPLAKGALLGGVYGYLDPENRLVVIDGNNNLLRVGHRRTTTGGWELYIAERTPVDGAISALCGGPGCDNVIAEAPDWQGRVWFVTSRALVGVVDPASGQTRMLALPDGERLGNSLATGPHGVAIATDHALYVLTSDTHGRPHIGWRAPYDRGPARKPGQLTWGTGSTPTFFGPDSGTDYVAIVDNATPRANLLVFDAATGARVCQIPVLSEDNSGSENSPIGSGRSVFVASTYGYPYPALPEGAGPSEPESAPFVGGMARVDIRPDGAGCEHRWTNTVRSSAVPKLSLADGLIYTMTRRGQTGVSDAGSLDSYEYAVIDPNTGNTLGSEFVGAGPEYDTLQMTGTITPEGVVYQGTMTGIIRITAHRP